MVPTRNHKQIGLHLKYEHEFWLKIPTKSFRILYSSLPDIGFLHNHCFHWLWTTIFQVIALPVHEIPAPDNSLAKQKIKISNQGKPFLMTFNRRNPPRGKNESNHILSGWTGAHFKAVCLLCQNHQKLAFLHEELWPRHLTHSLKYKHKCWLQTPTKSLQLPLSSFPD